jgi:hypothetical protein
MMYLANSLWISACSRPSKTVKVIKFDSYTNVSLGPGVYSASNRNEYQKQKNNNVSGE